LRDEQEERWKAFHVLEQVARQAGHTELGRKAAEKIIACLSGINTGRFGRAREISDAISSWKRGLNASPAGDWPGTLTPERCSEFEKAIMPRNGMVTLTFAGSLPMIK
jgi:hypothetical protein